MKFKVKSKDCQLIVKTKTSSGEMIDENELDRFSRVFLRGFLKPKIIKKNQVEYTGPVGVSLHERLKKPITKRDFFFILEQIVVAVQNLQAHAMPINNLVMNLQYVFINEVTREVQFIYVPTTSGMANMNIIEFIEAIVYSVIPADDRDVEYASRFIYFFRAMKPLDINKIEEFVAKEDRSVVNTIKKQNASQSGFMTNKKQHYYEHYGEKKDMSDDGEEQTGLLEEYDDSTGLLTEEMDEDTGLLDDEATGLLADEDEDEATGLLRIDEDEATGLLDEPEVNVHFPSLYRVLTEETIYLNKPVFRLGKEKSYVDYFITNNIAVSRGHADIITRGSRYFVIDLNSKNHTYINSQEIPIQCEIEIHDGDRLTLGNEEFIFRL